MNFSFKVEIELDDEGQKVVVNGTEQKPCGCGEPQPQEVRACGAKYDCEDSIPESSVPCSTESYSATGYAVWRYEDGVPSCVLDRCKPGFHCEPPAAKGSSGEEKAERPEGYLICEPCVENTLPSSE